MTTDVADAVNAFRYEGRRQSEDNPFNLTSSFDGPAEDTEIRSAWAETEPPTELVQLWRTTRSCRLLEDAEYGQWGLVLLSPQESARRTAQERVARPGEYRDDDVVVGQFLGDLELLVLAPSGEGLSQVLIALPLDDRSQWYLAADDLTRFLRVYWNARGDKFWEGARRR